MKQHSYEDYGFDPMDKHREPREEGWKKQTEQIIFQLRNRGDQRIGQLILNAVRNYYGDEVPNPKEMVDFDKSVEEMSDEEVDHYMKELERAETAQKAWLENELWNMEAPKLLEALKTMSTESGEESQ